MDVLRLRAQHVIMVTNEVGMGLVPETPLGRVFRDVAGSAHQRLSQCADEVYLAVLGTVLRIKPACSCSRIRRRTSHDRFAAVLCRHSCRWIAEAGLEAQRRLDAKTKPRRSLGLLEDLACRLAAIYRSPDPADAAGRRS